MSGLIGICTRILRDVDYDLIPADVVVTGGKVRDWGIEQREFEHGQGLAPVSPKRVVMVQNLDGTQVIDAEWHYNGPKLTAQQANDILEWQEQQEEIAASYRCQ